MNDYAISKWAGELMCLNSAEMFGTETVRVRPINCYGPQKNMLLTGDLFQSYLSGLKWEISYRLKRETSLKKSIKSKQLKVGRNNDYLNKVLFF